MLTSIAIHFAIPEWFFFVVAGCFGAIIGSFLNVYIYRFHTGKSLAGNSHCLSCATPLKWYELFPIVSYLVIQGRCRHCSSRVPVRYFLVELLTACLFALGLTVASTPITLAIIWFITSILVVILVYDFYHFIIPDGLSLTLLVAVAALLLHDVLLLGQPLSGIWIDAAAALAGSAFFLFLWVISKGEWLGFGDVKLAFPLGLLVGASAVFSFIVLSFWIGAGISVLLLLWQYLKRGKSHLRLVAPSITMKTAVPFAPFLISGALVTFFLSINVLTLFRFFV